MTREQKLSSKSQRDSFKLDPSPCVKLQVFFRLPATPDKAVDPHFRHP